MDLKWKKFPVLDDGFVCLVDVMGNDSSVVQAARVSYGAGTKKVSDDTNLIRYLMRNQHCYDLQTEVLTDKGFISWGEAYKTKPKLGLWDPEKQSLVYESPEYFTRNYYEGEMYRVEHGGVDLLVTPDHSMWVKRKWWDPFRQKTVWTVDYDLVKASKLSHTSMVRYSKLAPYHKEDFTGYNLIFDFDNARELLRLFGFFIGDGYVSSQNTITFRLEKERKRSYLKELCINLGWKYEVLADVAIAINKPDIGDYFKGLFYSGNTKTIPNFLLDLNQEDSRAVLDGLKNSDGSTKRGTWEYSSSVKEIAERVQVIALHAGEAAHFYSNNDMWRTMILSRMREPVINQSKRNTSYENYSGYVYCAKTRTGILVVRRNGKIVLSGNTTPFEMAEIKLLVRVPMDCWRQWIRHRTANVNEYSTRYSVAIDRAQKTKKWRKQSKKNKQGSADSVLDEWPEGYRKIKWEGEGREITFMDHQINPGDEVIVDSDGEPVCYGYFTPSDYLEVSEHRTHEHTRSVYKHRLALGVAREQARKDLPLSTYTEAYWKIDLHNLLNFLRLRMHSHAQEEIREYANTIGLQIVKPLFPIVWEAFQDYKLNGLHLSCSDIAALKDVHDGVEIETVLDRYFTSKREKQECRNKLERLGLCK